MICCQNQLSTRLTYWVNNRFNKLIELSPVKHSDTPCFLCKTSTRTYEHICDACFTDLPYRYAHCAICRVPMTIIGHVCPECNAQTKPYDYCTVGTHYTFPANRIVAALKVGRKRYVAQIMAQAICHRRAQLDGTTLPDTICCIPMHPTKLKRTGFNHAELIAKACAQKLGIIYTHKALIKTMNTEKQVGLNRKARLKNIKAALKADETFSIAGKHVAIVDDVMTTGATLESAAELLKRQGAKTVEIWAFSRTPKG